MTPRLLSPPEVAELRGCSPTTVCAALRDGTLRGQRIGRAWIVRESDAMRWTPRPVGWRKGRARKVG